MFSKDSSAVFNFAPADFCDDRSENSENNREANVAQTFAKIGATGNSKNKKKLNGKTSND